MTGVQTCALPISQTPLLVVNTSDLDFVKREDLDDLMKQIQSMGKGTQYYVPRA